MDYIFKTPIRVTISSQGPDTWQITFEQATNGQKRNRKYRIVKGSKSYANSVKDKMLLELITRNFCDPNNMTASKLPEIWDETNSAIISPTTKIIVSEKDLTRL